MCSHHDGVLGLAGQNLIHSERHMAECRTALSRRRTREEVVKCSRVVFFRSIVLGFLDQKGTARLARLGMPLRQGQSNPCHRRGLPTPFCLCSLLEQHLEKRVAHLARIIKQHCQTAAS